MHQHPAGPMAADQHAAEIHDLLNLLRQLAETARDDEWAAMRPSVVTLTFVMQDMAAAASAALRPAQVTFAGAAA